MRYVIVTAFALLVLAACSATPTGQLYKKYAEAARQLGINPVYPPREEFQIGDVYLVSLAPDDPDGAASLWLGTLDTLRFEAEEFLKSRVVFKDTEVVNKEVATGQPRTPLSQDDLFSPRLSTRDDERILTLPVAAYPSINTQAGFTQSTGLTAAMAAIGFGSSEETRVILDFNDVRTYWVPQMIAAKYYDEAMDKASENLREAVDLMKRQVEIKEFNDGQKSGKRCLRVAVVTRVYLTRQIQYTYRDRQIVAAGLKIAEKEAELAKVSPPPEINVTVVKSGTNTADDDADETLKLAESLRTSVGSVGTGAQGGSLSFVSWNARGVTFEQTYRRPVAIGWEGFEFDFTGSVFGQPSCRDGKIG